MEPTPAPRLVPEPPSARRWLAARLLALLGWRVEVTWPTAPKVVVIVYPHTSNWDFFLGYLARLAMGLPTRWIGKHTIFRWPVRGLLLRMGGIPVDRAHAAGLIPSLVAEFGRREAMCLALAPEGTRAYRDHLKSGFYRLALAARVPVGLAFIDFGTRTIGVTRWLDLTGDEEADLEEIRRAYQGKLGRHPAQAAAIRFKPERGEGGGGGPAEG
ncbi:MAG: 1-acyl-sn-glycerol-3-phosphate acyltransferase [Anaeromyxobacteraceae bacterium]|nr:1-acyl-sn-glycerol-3-phosphate acyltransferase [Anaeromyxobacteraceae bacterium]